MNTRSVTWRVFVSFGLTATFLAMLLSGIVLFTAPPGRVANWTGWRVFGLQRSQWHDQHVVFALLFTVLSLFHLLLFNWKTFLAYLKSHTAQGLQHIPELLLALVLTIITAVGTHTRIQPFVTFLDVGRKLADSWDAVDKRPPVPHAEKMTLEELSNLPQVGLTADTMLERLKSAGIMVSDPKETLQHIAAANGKEVMDIYAIMTSSMRKGKKLSEAEWSMHTLAEVAEGQEVSATALQMALNQQGIKSQTDDRLADIAKRNRMPVGKLLDRIEAITEKR